jgi:predicted metalloendopeptidase
LANDQIPDLDDALGPVYVRYASSPQLKRQTLDMVKRIEDAMGKRLRALDWMSSEFATTACTQLRDKVILQLRRS